MKSLKPVLYASALVGVLDITAACIQVYIERGRTPVRLLQGIAAGLLGRGALNGGLAIAALGLVFHFMMALTVTAVFYGLSRRFPALLRYAVPAGVVYGLIVFSINNFATAPFMSWLRSLYLHTPVSFRPPMGWVQAIIHVFCVGLPIALVLRQFGHESIPNHKASARTPVQGFNASTD